VQPLRSAESQGLEYFDGLSFDPGIVVVTYERNQLLEQFLFRLEVVPDDRCFAVE